MQKQSTSTPSTRNQALKEALSLFLMAMVLVVLSMWGDPAHGQEAPFSAPMAESFSADCSTTLWSAYILTIGARGSADDESVVQVTCATSHTSGFYGGWWLSQSTRSPGRGETFANEIDWFVGWAGEMRGVGLNAAVQYYDLANPTLLDGTAGDLWDFGITAVVPLTSVWRLTADSHYLVEADADAVQAIPGGWYAQVGVGRDWQTAMLMSADIFLVHNEGVGGFDTDLIRVVGSVGRWEKRGLTLSVPFTLSLPLHGDVVEDEWAIGLSVDF